MVDCDIVEQSLEALADYARVPSCFAYAEFPHETELVWYRFLEDDQRPAEAEALSAETRER